MFYLRIGVVLPNTTPTRNDGLRYGVELPEATEGVMGRKRGLIAGAVGTALLVGAAVRGVVRRFAIVEASMEPTLSSGDWVFARRTTGEIERGDIVIFDDPTVKGRQLVKRVIGMPWERVGIDGGRVTINGALLADRWAHGTNSPEGEWQVPGDHVWVLGDNRVGSMADSRTIGPVPLNTVNWVVVARYWPSSRAGRIA